ncbi:MAG TPA: hypothetical protein VFA89_20245 [Terriglobales bacterium]|nr:hypothetical protein [Terriglobales bacterium]
MSSPLVRTLKGAPALGHLPQALSFGIRQKGCIGRPGLETEKLINAGASDDIKGFVAESTCTVLHVCPDRTLAGSRRRVLTALGCDVVWVHNEGAALLEISLGRCGILLLCHLLPAAVRASLTDFFHAKCPDPYIVAIVAHEAEPHPPRAHARVVHSPDHAALAAVMRQRLAA